MYNQKSIFTDYFVEVILYFESIGEKALKNIEDTENIKNIDNTERIENAESIEKTVNA